MVLNALSIDPKRPWKGSWRWFHEQLLDCCLPLATVAKEGVVLTQVCVWVDQVVALGACVVR
jgi:glutathione gamma-glutamylcysteinyltransferase